MLRVQGNQQKPSPQFLNLNYFLQQWMDKVTLLLIINISFPKEAYRLHSGCGPRLETQKLHLGFF